MGARKYATEEERKAAKREINRKAQAKWRAANREKDREKVRAFSEANPEAVKERRARWRKKEDEKKIAELKLGLGPQVFGATPGLRCASTQRRRARKLSQHGLLPVTAEVISQRFELFGHACAYCGAQHGLTVDHFIPLGQGGTHAPSNLVPACPSCNSSKRDSDPEQWYRQQPSFNEQRWKQIQKATGHHKAPGQLALV